MENEDLVEALEPTNAPPGTDRVSVPREWQFSLRSLLLITTVASVCLAMGTYFVGFAFAAFVLVLLEVVVLFSFEWLIRPANRRLLSFVVTGSWIILGSGLLIVSFSLAYGRLAAGDTGGVWIAIVFIALAAPVCYFVAWRRWKRLTGQRREVELRDTTTEERFNMVWQLTVEEWAKKGIDITKLPMQKDVVRLARLKDK